MHIATATLRSTAYYSQGRPHDTPKLPKEGADAYEERTWRNRLHVTDDGRVFIPQMAFKNALAEAAKFGARQIPGKGKSTYTKHFLSGVLVLEPLVLDVKASDVPGHRLFLPADGKKLSAGGSGKRVWKVFPLIREWGGDVTFHVIDDTITEDVFTATLREAGLLIGLGFFRPANGGFYGRFDVERVTWK